MLAGQGGTLLVGGEAGIGKTTLVEDLSIEAEEQDCLVLWGHAYDLSVTPPYGPWLEIFRQYRSTADRDLPPLPPFVGDLNETAAMGSQDALFVAVADFFTAVAAQCPLVLVLDDLHWFDQASLDFCRFLARQVENHRIVVVATYRADELHRRHPLYALLPLLVREAGAQRVEVQRLDAVGHQALIQRQYALPEDDQRRLERYLEEHAEGNPLYAGELLRTLEESGVLTKQEDAWLLGDLTQVRVPPLLRQVIEGRLARLHHDTRQLLQIAAVIGQDVPLDLWQQVSGADDNTLMTAIEQGQSTQLIEEVSDTRYRFRHALLREALYEEVIALRRRVWHRTIGDVLRVAANPDLDSVAYHFQAGGDPRAAEWLLKAGERAQRTYAWLTAAARYEAALALLQTDGADAAVLGWLLLRIALLHRHSDRARAVALLEGALEQAAHAADPLLAAYAQFNIGLIRCYTGEFGTGVAAMAAAVAALDVLPPADLATRARLRAWGIGRQPGPPPWHSHHLVGRGRSLRRSAGARRACRIQSDCLSRPGMARWRVRA